MSVTSERRIPEPCQTLCCYGWICIHNNFKLWLVLFLTMQNKTCAQLLTNVYVIQNLKVAHVTWNNNVKHKRKAYRSYERKYSACDNVVAVLLLKLINRAAFTPRRRSGWDYSAVRAINAASLFTVLCFAKRIAWTKNSCRQAEIRTHC